VKTPPSGFGFLVIVFLRVRIDIGWPAGILFFERFTGRREALSKPWQEKTII
jgi:hypothetical protein